MMRESEEDNGHTRRRRIGARTGRVRSQILAVGREVKNMSN